MEIGETCMEINLELLKKYEIAPLNVLKEYHGDDIQTEIFFYKEFLKQTDHIPNKMFEAQVLGVNIDDYTEILKYRQAARDRINSLMTGEKKEE